MRVWLLAVTRGHDTQEIFNVCNGFRERSIGFVNEMMNMTWFEIEVLIPMRLLDPIFLFSHAGVNLG